MKCAVSNVKGIDCSLEKILLDTYIIRCVKTNAGGINILGTQSTEGTKEKDQ